MFSSASFAAAPTTAEVHAQQRAEAKAHLPKVKDRFAKIKAQVAGNPLLESSPYMRLDLTIVERFLQRVESPAPNQKQLPEWNVQQLKELDFVLDDAQRLLNVKDPSLHRVPKSLCEQPELHGDTFLARTWLPGDEAPTLRPTYFGGYGHFDQIFKDLANFPSLGVNLIQDGRHGPDKNLLPDYTLEPKFVATMKANFAAAKKAGVMVDVLTSPHYFPGWAVQATPEMNNGTPFMNIDHPAERKVIESWLRQVARLLKDEPALFSYCLSNEPAYGSSGRDKWSAPAWHEYLKEKHKAIESLNALYGTKYKSFEEVPCGGGDDVGGKRCSYDWFRFNFKHFAGWHKWMSDVIKSEDPKARTHAKIMVFFVFDRDKLGYGIDPEEFADATDIGGCDAYSQIFSPVGGLDDTSSKDFAYYWQVEELCYDLLNSFRNQTVFNSEAHPNPNAAGTYPFPAAHSRASIWQGAMHHQGAETTWVWEEAVDPAGSLNDSVFFRPANIQGSGRAILDLNRLGTEVAAINDSPANVALLYSQPSIIWQDGYGQAVKSVYTAVNLSGQKVTFVSERQLAEGRAAKVRVIILPRATHISDAAFAALMKYQSTGGKIILAGDECAAFDEYHRPRPLSADFAKVPKVPLTDDRAVAAALRPILASSGVKLTNLTTAGSKDPAWGVEYRIISSDKSLLVPMINLMKKPQTVKLGLVGKATDLLSGKEIDLSSITLPPMEPLLLRVR
ncbi:MAG TPA: beta-galactosidase [Tepidisphaeraceae bacterium]|nr:beta-galactosidase [Tepidisphaeraceae bacterium]